MFDEIFKDIAVDVVHKAMIGQNIWERSWSDRIWTDHKPIFAAEHVIKSTGVFVDFSCAYQPAYLPTQDMIRFPLPQNFKTSDDYYYTIFHELGHWTGNEHRLNRETLYSPFESEQHSIEEITVELVSAFICGVLGIGTSEQSANYITNHFYEGTSGNTLNLHKAVFEAARAANFILIKGNIKWASVKKQHCPPRPPPFYTDQLTV